ncbi:MAG: DUF6088 family protein [Lachnospiraceae bacterium]|nr:DUF6088 family protein [Lachnospiraceae bacterium]
MLYQYLVEKYKPNEPIFVSDINLPISDGNLRQMFKNLCDDGLVKRFDTGVYYIPKESRLKGGVPLGADTVAKAKYISRNGNIDGYYAGYTFANQLGLTVQVPYVTEIVSNNASARVREIKMKGKRIVLRKSRAQITKENCRVLQFLDLLKDIDTYIDCSAEDASERLMNYIRTESITRNDIDKYISQFPVKVYKNMYEMRLYNVFA